MQIKKQILYEMSLKVIFFIGNLIMIKIQQKPNIVLLSPTGQANTFYSKNPKHIKFITIYNKEKHYILYLLSKWS